MDRAALAIALCLLGACAAVAPETPEQMAQRHSAECRQAGLDPASDIGRLCLLLEQQNDQLAALEQRLRLIETHTLTPGPFFGRCCWW
jgi:hypothetical protein